MWMAAAVEIPDAIVVTPQFVVVDAILHAAILGADARVAVGQGTWPVVRVVIDLALATTLIRGVAMDDDRKGQLRKETEMVRFEIKRPLTRGDTHPAESVRRASAHSDVKATRLEREI